MKKKGDKYYFQAFASLENKITFEGELYVYTSTRTKL